MKGLPLLLRTRALHASMATLAALSCGCAPLTREQTQEALEESRRFAAASTLLGLTAELTGSFSAEVSESGLTALEQSVGEFSACVGTSRKDETLTIDYGTREQPCRVFDIEVSGRQVVSVHSLDDGQVDLEHEWQDLSDGRVRITGTGETSWRADRVGRRLEFDATWTVSGLATEGTASLFQKPVAGALERGLEVDGTASWLSGEANDLFWRTTLNGTEKRWTDPLPEDGGYFLDSPFNQRISLLFERVSATTIRVMGSNLESEPSFEFRETTPSRD